MSAVARALALAAVGLTGVEFFFAAALAAFSGLEVLSAILVGVIAGWLSVRVEVHTRSSKEKGQDEHN